MRDLPQRQGRRPADLRAPPPPEEEHLVLRQHAGKRIDRRRLLRQAERLAQQRRQGLVLRRFQDRGEGMHRDGRAERCEGSNRAAGDRRIGVLRERRDERERAVLPRRSNSWNGARAAPWGWCRGGTARAPGAGRG